MKRYTHVFFDLDRTLWDFETNSKLAIKEIFKKGNLEKQINNFDKFLTSYKKYNELLWDRFRKGDISKSTLRQERFSLTLKEFGIEDEKLAAFINKEYIQIVPRQKSLLPNTEKVLHYLHNKYQLHIITNGFNEVQQIKIQSSSLAHYFTKVITSENAGYHKPRPEIFMYALSSANAKKQESIMIGDDLTIDILGARDFGIDQIFFNINKIKHRELVTFEISNLLELIRIL